MEAQREYLHKAVARISGAVQILEELLAECRLSEGEGGGAVGTRGLVDMEH